MLSRPVTAADPLTADSKTKLTDATVVDVRRTIVAGPPPVRRPITPPPDETDDDEPLWGTEQVSRFWRPASSCLASLVLHALLVILLGLLFVEPRGHGKSLSLMASSVETSENEALDSDDLATDAADSQILNDSSISTFEQTSQDLAQSIADDRSASSATASQRAETMVHDNVTEMLWHAPAGMLGDGEIAISGDGDVSGALGGRSAAARKQLAESGGGTPESEDAVSRGLRWLQAHQRPDGSWCFNLKQTPCEGRCSESGTEASLTGATGLALLAFLGRGETHFESEYQDTVKRGLYFLTSQMLMTPQGGDLRGAGNMYSQGIATIALCEAYAMTRDKELEPFAQKAIDFIVSAQHRPGGGWRYHPGELGDTTVTGWQVMALKSGQMGYLRVPYEAIVGANRFLDSVQVERGARYSYQPRKDREEMTTTSSVGLLCRMYLGWAKDEPGLRKGVELLSRQGPSILGRGTNMYYNYYATQIMHQYGGEPWELWNNRMREFLVHTQSKEGHEAGSWYFDGGQAHAGGRLYVTAVSVMTLEVYYRHLPLYAPHAVGY